MQYKNGGQLPCPGRIVVKLKKIYVVGIFYLCWSPAFFYDRRVKRKRKWEECLDFCALARFYPYYFLQPMYSRRGILVRLTRSTRHVIRGIIWWAARRPQPITAPQQRAMPVLHVVMQGRVVPVPVARRPRFVIFLFLARQVNILPRVRRLVPKRAKRGISVRVERTLFQVVAHQL